MVYCIYCSLLINWNAMLRYSVNKAELQIDKQNPSIDHTFTGVTLPAKQRNDQDQGLSLGIAAKISWEGLLLLIASWVLTIQRYHLRKQRTCNNINTKMGQNLRFVGAPSFTEKLWSSSSLHDDSAWDCSNPYDRLAAIRLLTSLCWEHVKVKHSWP